MKPHSICEDCLEKQRRIDQLLDENSQLKALFGNQLIARIAFMHYVHGIPLGRICDQMGLDLGSVVQMLHRLAGLFKPVLPRLIERYRLASVRHADETSWRTDGRSGYAWLFCTPDLSIFMFRQTRSASVPREVFGNLPLPGVLVVDRYNGYNQVPCKNNRSERELRPTVIARKVSFGSQSEAGAKTREIMMSLLLTLKKRQQHAEDYFKSVLDRLAGDIKQDPLSLLFPADSS